MISLLHTADWQIGRVFSQFEPDDAAALFEARFKVIERLASIATERNVDAVLVAGDVFDAQTIADKTIRRLFNAMRGFTGAWLLISGNHDSALSESIWTRAHRLGVIPSNVTCCLEPMPHNIGGKFTLLPAPLTQRHTYGDLTAWFGEVPNDGRLIRVGLAHGCVEGVLPEGIDSTNPIAANRAEHANLDYLALGDWHGTKCIDSKTWYAGTPETDRFKANDSGQALLVSIEGVGAQPQVEVIRTGQFRWQQLDPQLAVTSDVDALLATLGAISNNDVLQLSPQGTCDMVGHRRILSALEAARAHARALVWNADALRLEPTEEDIQSLRADGFVGEALADLRSQQSLGESTLARDALLALARILDAQGLHAGAQA